MTKPQHKSIKQKSKDQEQELTNSDLEFIKSSFIGTLTVILSGLILYLDKIIVFFDLNFQMPSRYESYDLETFVWSISVTLSPFLLIIAAHLKTNKFAYAVPLYAYTLQLWFIVYDLNIVDKIYTYWYALGTSVLVFIVWRVYNNQEKKSIQLRYKKLKGLLKNDL